MASVSGMSAAFWLQSALSKPLPERCNEIRQLLTETSIKELHAILPNLIQSIFGFGSQSGWGLNRISKSNSQDFNTVRQFLHPDGPVLRLIYKLTTEPLRYEFPFMCLPFPVQKLIERGTIPPLFAESIQPVSGTRPYQVLSLNAFELYFFHFAYCLVSPQDHKLAPAVNPQDALYTVLLEEYLNYFLPLDGRPVLSPLSDGTTVKSPFMQQSPCSPMSYLSPVAMQRMYSPYTSPISTRVIGQPAAEHTEHETWRSMTFLQTLVEFWLHQTSLELDKLSYINPTIDSFLPSTDHVRVVRMLVKHLHYFANSPESEVILSPYSTHITNPWDSFKRSVIPQFLKKRLYDFLKHNFERWPLDPSFRLVLETWLSYIQPWRYTDPKQSNRDKEQQHKDKVVEEKWRSFITENLLFYSVLFRCFVERMLKTELTSAKNAYILFRVTKVFNLPRLHEMLKELEYMLSDSQQISLPVLSPIHSKPDSCLAPMSREHGNLINMLSIVISELEGPGFQFVYMFNSDTRSLVQQLLQLVAQAKETAAMTAASSNSCSWSFLSSLWTDTADYDSEAYDDISGHGNIRKVELYLTQVTRNLCEIFEVTAPERPDKGVKWGPTPSYVSPNTSHSIPDVDHTEHGPELGPLARYQIINGLRKFEILPLGDPDLQPIRSYEIPWLVRLLYSVTNFINTNYHNQLVAVYNRNDFLGRLSHVFLSPPGLITSPQRLKSLSPSAQKTLSMYRGPRLTLRYLATYPVIISLALCYLVLYILFRLSVPGFTMLVVVSVFLYACCKAAIMMLHDFMQARTEHTKKD